MLESLITSICAAGARGIAVRDLFDRSGRSDSDIRQWLWTQLLQAPGISFTKGGEALQAPSRTRHEEFVDSDQIRVVAAAAQREVYLGVHQRSHTLSAVQMTLLEAIGSGQASGCTRAEIDAFIADDPVPHKEFFRHAKALLSRNLIVRINDFSDTPRIGKYAPPTAYPRWFLRRFIQMPLPVRSWTVALASSAIQQQCIERRKHIDAAVVPVLMQYLSERSPRSVPEPELHSFALGEKFLDDLDWVAVRERLFATYRVAWDYSETSSNQFMHSFRLVGAVNADPADIPIEDALSLRESHSVMSLDNLRTPLIAQIYRLIDASGSSGILSLTLFRQLRLMQRRGHKIIKELTMLPGNDAIVMVADRHKTSLVYRLYRKANMVQNSSKGTIKVESRSSRRRSRSDMMIEDEENESDEEEDESGRILDSVFIRRLRWIRDIVAARKAVSLSMLRYIVRHREVASVA